MANAIITSTLSQDVSSLLRMATNESKCYNFDNSATSIIGQLLMATVILLLNFMVVAVICKNRRRTFRKPAFIFIVFLATTDILLAFFLISFSAVAIADLQLSSDTWVNLAATTSVCFNASVNFLFVIALDRLCFIAYNRRYNRLMRNRNVALLITLCWVIGILPVLPLFFSNIGSCAKHCTCVADQFLNCSHNSCSSVVKGFTKRFLFGLFFYFLFMLVSISAIYVILFLKVHRQANRVRSASNESSAKGRSSRMRREFRLARTLTVVVVTFFLCWSPLMLLYVIDFTTDNFNVTSIIAQTIITPAVFNSMLNPIIYAARIPILKNYFCFCGCKSNKDSSTDRKRKSSGSSNSKNANKQNTLPKPNHIYKRNERASDSGCYSSPAASQVTYKLVDSKTPQKETVKFSWPPSATDHLRMIRSSSMSSLNHSRVNYSGAVQRSSLRTAPSRKVFLESSRVVETPVSSSCAENV